jgi:hypothetical protein
MRPDVEFFYVDSCETRVGELNENNDLHGRGIYLYFNAEITIGYWLKGGLSIGHYIDISSDGMFSVAE